MRLAILIFFSLLIFGCETKVPPPKPIATIEYATNFSNQIAETLKINLYQVRQKEDSIIIGYIPHYFDSSKVLNRFDRANYEQIEGTLDNIIYHFVYPSTFGNRKYPKLAAINFIDTAYMVSNRLKYEIGDSIYNITVLENFMPAIDGDITTVLCDKIGILGSCAYTWQNSTLITKHSDSIMMNHIDSIYKLLVLDTNIRFLVSYKGIKKPKQLLVLPKGISAPPELKPVN